VVAAIDEHGEELLDVGEDVRRHGHAPLRRADGAVEMVEHD